VSRSTVCASNFVGSSRILSASEGSQRSEGASSIELGVECSDIKVVGELRKAIDEVVRGDSNRNGDIEAEFANITQFCTTGQQNPNEEGNQQEDEKIHLSGCCIVLACEGTMGLEELY